MKTEYYVSTFKDVAETENVYVPFGITRDELESWVRDMNDGEVYSYPLLLRPRNLYQHLCSKDTICIRARVG